MISRMIPNKVSLRCLIIGVATAVSVNLLANAALPQQPVPHVTPQLFRLPPKFGTVSRLSGLSVELMKDNLLPGSGGYRTFEFLFQSPTPLTADRSITVRAFATDWPGSRNVISAEADLDMVIGQKVGVLQVRVPQYSELHWLSWDVWVDGVKDSELSQPRDRPFGLPGSQSGVPQHSGLRVWFAGTTKVAGNNQFVVPTFGRVSNSDLRSQLQVVVLPLSDDCFDYFAFDVVHIDFKTLRSQAQTNPDAVLALRKWVAAGGNLWVEQMAEESKQSLTLDKLMHRGPEAIGKMIAGKTVSYDEIEGMDWQKLGVLESLLDMPRIGEFPLPARTVGGDSPGALRWNYIRLFRPPTADERDGLEKDFGESLESVLRATNQLTQKSVYSEDWFAVRRFGWGTVGAYTSSWTSVPRQLSRDQRNSAMGFWAQRSWPNRHGLVPDEANADFSNWLIPGVGLAPVIEFQILITLFVLGIGPLNYWLLKRSGRLHMLVLTVPAAALLITGGLLAYGLLADGFGTRVRALSITLLDQKRGEAISWNRLSYYAAFAPRDGLTFSAETAVYPILPGYEEGYASPGGNGQRDIVWTDDDQRLTSGWISSRTPTQYLTIEPHKTDARLELRTRDNALIAKNLIGADAQLILVIDGEGEWHGASDLASGDSAELEAITHNEAVAQLRKLLTDRGPRVPDAVAATEESVLYHEQRRLARRQFRNSGYDYGGANATQSLLHQRWQELLGNSGGEPLDLPPRSYVFISETTALASLGLDSAREDASVHIVIGTW